MIHAYINIQEGFIIEKGNYFWDFMLKSQYFLFEHINFIVLRVERLEESKGQKIGDIKFFVDLLQHGCNVENASILLLITLKELIILVF